jgi:hypothetical protein
VPWLYNNLAAQSTVVVSSGPVDLIAVVVGTAAAGSVVTVFDGVNTTTTGLPVVATIDASATGNFFFGCICRSGITVTMSGGTAKITTIFDQYGYEPGDLEAIGQPPYVDAQSP